MDFGEFGARPEGMTIDPDTGIYHKQYDIDFQVDGIGQKIKVSDRLKLNLYYDSVLRGLEIRELEIAISNQGSALE